MTNKFSPKVSEILDCSRQEAQKLACGAITPELILLGLLGDDNNALSPLFLEKNILADDIRAELVKQIQEHFSQTQENVSAQDNDILALDENANNILRLAVLEARLQHTQEVEPTHLILAILHDNMNNGAKKILMHHNISYEDVLNNFQHKTNMPQNGLDIPEEEYNASPSQGNNYSSSDTSEPTPKQGATGTPVLDKFSTDLTRLAGDDVLDPVVGREKEIERVIEILCRRKKNNPILIGEPGVGKSAIVEGLAQLIAKKHVSPMLFNKRIISLNMTNVVAGTKYRGQFEERIQALLKEIEANPDIIVFIDEIHTIIGAGSAPGSMDAANIMKPALSRGKFQCIGATTLDEYRNSIEKDGALERRFQKVTVNATSEEETLEILHNIKDRYEDYHHVTYTDDALKACVKLTGRYITERFFPDKAIDAMDEVGAKVHLRHADVPENIREKEKEIENVKALKNEAVGNQNYEQAAAYRDQQTHMEEELKKMNEEWLHADKSTREKVNEEDVADVVSVMSGIPVKRVAEKESTRLKNMLPQLKDVVVGQDNAIAKVVKAIQRNRIGLKDPNRPIGVFMFLGPTGVGKTYLTKKIAETLFGTEDALIRVDMSEYSEKFNTSRLIGAPPGYVGYDEGGQLTEKVRRHPYSIVLLDEIEKAHSSVYNLLLQVFDEGRLTDGNGRLVDFRNTIVIMTSNTGTKQLKDFGRGIGFTAAGFSGADINESDKAYARSIIQKSLSQQFAPEFLNRLDDIIMFDQLDKTAIDTIVGMELEKLQKRIETMGYTMSVSDEARQFVASKGYDVQFGARPLKRAIQTFIEDEICEAILANDPAEGVNIKVDKDPDAEKLICSLA